MQYMYVLYVCSICMYYMYILYVCIYVQEFSFLSKASQINRPPGAKLHGKTIAANPRRSIFEKESALNLAFIADSESRGKMLHIPLKIMDLGALCVELWLKQVLHRILVPMSYISWLWGGKRARGYQGHRSPVHLPACPAGLPGKPGRALGPIILIDQRSPVN